MEKWLLLLILSTQLYCLQANEEERVVYIHGFMANYRTTASVRRLLHENFCEPYQWDYPSRDKMIEENACSLLLVLQEMACQCPCQPINFITHSVGAIVLRLALNLPGCPEEAKMGRAVLIAPPNQGSRLGRRFRNFIPLRLLMGSKSGRELLTYGPCEMLCFGEFPPNMPVLVIAGTGGSNFLLKEPNDGYIAVDETALNTPYCCETFPVTHGDLLYSGIVFRRIRDFLFCY